MDIPIDACLWAVSLKERIFIQLTVSNIDRVGGGGLHGTMDSILALHPAAPGWIPGIPKMLPKLIDGAAALSSG